VFESERVVINIIEAPFEVHPIEVRFRDIQSIFAHVLQVQYRPLLLGCFDLGAL
jgi:hypothetical protein